MKPLFVLLLFPFDARRSSDAVQRFEDNIRVATNNENMLFFLQVVDNKVFGLVVDVTHPSDTRLVWESDFLSWIPRWGRGPMIAINSPVTKRMTGYTYLLDPSGLSPANQFYSLSSGGSMFVDQSSGFFVLYEIATDAFFGDTVITNQARGTSITIPTTLPEKCDGFNGVFACAFPNTTPPLKTSSGYDTVFPDAWYQGDISSDDSIILTNTSTGEQKVVLSPSQEDIKVLSNYSSFDIIHPRISDDGEFLFFINKNDLSLWMLRLF